MPLVTLASPSPPPCDSPFWLEARCQHWDARTLLRWRDRAFSGAALSDRARRAAAALNTLGIRPGDRIGLWCANHPVYLDLFMAAPWLGAIIVPFNTRVSGAEFHGQLALTAPALVIAESTPPLFSGRLLAIDDYEVAIAKAAPIAAPRTDVVMDDPHCLLFTGGSTGSPKAAVIPYRQYATNAASTITHWGLSSDDRLLQSTPMFHAGMHALCTPLLACGAEVTLAEQFDPETSLTGMTSGQYSLAFGVPTIFQRIAELPAFATADLSGLRWAISGGAPCPLPIQNAWRARGVRFRQGYGLTECGVNCFWQTPTDGDRMPEAVGRPMPPLEARLVHADGAVLEGAGRGQLELRGPQVFSGYWQDATASASALGENGWLRTGDIATRCTDGRYRIVGRHKEMYISGGENVYPSEVEAAICALPGVLEAAVQGVQDSTWGEVGMAAVVLAPNTLPEVTRLQQSLQNLLARYKCPKHWLFMSSLPRTGAQKIDKPSILRTWQDRQQ